jgi:pimeloyl-ACP methyl ester carboxylesterase
MIGPVSGSTANASEAQTLILDGIWGPHGRWEGLRRRIEHGAGPCAIWRYPNWGFEPIAATAARLVAAVRACGGPVHLVGFSMGGLVVREAVRQDPGLPVRRAVFLHAPHRGSLAALLLPLPATRDMRPGSAFLRRLEASPWSIPCLATWCPFDLMVLPGVSSAWPRASQLLRVSAPAHMWPVFSRSLHERVVAFLRAETESVTRTRGETFDRKASR